MLPLKRYVIARHERGLLFRDRSLTALLEPGRYRYVDPLNRLTLERYDITEPRFSHPLEDVLLADHGELLGPLLRSVELGQREAGLVYFNERLVGLQPPGSRRLYWRGPIEVRVERCDLSTSYRLPDGVAALLPQTPERAREAAGSAAAAARALHQAVTVVDVGDAEVGLLLIDGELRETLRPGRHAFWTLQRSLQVERIDTRLQPLEVAGQDMLSKDRVSVRVNLVAHYRVSDAARLRAQISAGKAYLYRALQFGLRRAVGARPLDELLAKRDLDQEIFDDVVARIGDCGLTLTGVGVKDVILPGDMKDILNRVVETEKIAQANVIKRREETAATRSLLNTAKLMEDNPTLLRLKELETLEKLTAKVDKLTVFGGLDGLLNETLKVKSG